MDVGVLVPDAARTDDVHLLLLAPAATHVDELRIVQEQLGQAVGILLRHPGPLLIREVDQLLLFLRKLLLCKCRHTSDDQHCENHQFLHIFNLLLTGCKGTKKTRNYFDNNYGFSFTFFLFLFPKVCR